MFSSWCTYWALPPGQFRHSTAWQGGPSFGWLRSLGWGCTFECSGSLDLYHSKNCRFNWKSDIQPESWRVWQKPYDRGLGSLDILGWCWIFRWSKWWPFLAAISTGLMGPIFHDLMAISYRNKELWNHSKGFQGTQCSDEPESKRILESANCQLGYYSQPNAQRSGSVTFEIDGLEV